MTINYPDYVDKNIIPAIEQQGIGNIEEVRKNIVAQIISNPVPEDVARLSDKEKAQVEQYLGQEVSTLTAQRDELHQKNSIIQRIMVLANRRKSIKKEISIEEQSSIKSEPNRKKQFEESIRVETTNDYINEIKKEEFLDKLESNPKLLYDLPIEKLERIENYYEDSIKKQEMKLAKMKKTG